MISADAPADLLFRGGPVFSAGTVIPAGAVAVSGGRIAALGPAAEALAGTRTEVVELAGRLLLPGFVDAHVHPGSAGLERLRCDLSAYRTRAAYLDAIGAYAAEHPGREWILGGGWAMDQFPGGTPRREDLDAIVADRPVFLPNRDHHAVWVNSEALRRAGIDARTPDPADGRIERDPDGRPTGTLHEGAAALVGRLVGEPTPAELLDGLREGQRVLHSFGITAWQDAIVGAYDSLPDVFDTYRELEDRGELTGRVVGALWWERERGLDQLPFLLERRRATEGRRFRATAVKMMLDGVCETFTASMHEPYVGHGGQGLDFIDPGELAGYVTALDAAGFQVHFHAIGDRAVSHALDAVAAARSANNSMLRHHIAHVQVVRPEDLPRFRTLGVAATVQALWACHEPQMTELTLPVLTAERAGWQYPFGSFARSGVRLAFGSDWPVSSPDPLQAVHVAVHRTVPPSGDTGDPVQRRPFLPEQRLDLATALTGYTQGSAWVNGMDASAGEIAVGRPADLVLLDRDVFSAPVAAAAVERTLAAGQTVYSRQ
ncbi:amidohydrolase [Hamadaea tsunoensis]|uniref:amidohydrolase n=1 Tax=Hamadaea tsunoensis TaxID=53368 RepID=UPI00041F0F44|nr:amidohydrolase [Hamadaea tsunoensis]